MRTSEASGSQEYGSYSGSRRSLMHLSRTSSCVSAYRELMLPGPSAERKLSAIITGVDKPHLWYGLPV